MRYVAGYEPPLIPVERLRPRRADAVKVGDTVQTWEHGRFVVTAITEGDSGLLVFAAENRWPVYVRFDSEVDVLVVEHVAENEVWCEVCSAVLETDYRGIAQRCLRCDDGRDCVL